MGDNHQFRWFYVLFIITFFFSSCTDGKGFGGGRGGGGFRGGSRGGGSIGGSKGSGVFGGSSSNTRYGSYNTMNKPRSGSSFKKNAMTFGAGALGGVAAYSLMRSMSSSYHGGSGYYRPGYGTGETCINNQDMNGTKFGSFRCPLNNFPLEAKYCCGDYGKQYCCAPDATRSGTRSTSSLIWIFLIITLVGIGIFLFIKYRRQREKGVIMVPMEPPADEQYGQPFYQPPPPPMGYPPPPSGNPYGIPPQNYDGSYNPYAQQMQYPPQQQMQYPPQQQMQYPPQQQMPYPPQQQAYNPYQVKEGGPPAYDDAMHNNQGAQTTKPM